MPRSSRRRASPAHPSVPAAALHAGPLILLALCLAAAPAAAQFFQFDPQSQQQQPPKPRTLPPRPKPVPQSVPDTDQPPTATTPYDHDLQRLTEILGALHFLRGICGANDGAKWRDEAQTLIEAEAPSGDRHEKLVQAFNRGYLGFQQSYRTCTPAANVIIRRYLQEGAKIARDITARYAN
jgi:uncharacterized protein (TIGR02301 family)